MSVEEWMERYESIRNWFVKPSGERRYTPATEKQYVQYMKNLFCKLSGLTPDELANCKDMAEQKRIITLGMRMICHLSIRSITYRIHALNSFWRYNRRQIKGTYEGVPKDMTRDILRSKRVKPSFAKERKVES